MAQALLRWPRDTSPMGIDVEMKVVLGTRGIATLGVVYEPNEPRKIRRVGRSQIYANTSSFVPVLQAIVSDEGELAFMQLLRAANALCADVFGSGTLLHRIAQAHTDF
eukprot:10564493-Alexandrium_andersonii.AAC.1